MKVFKKKFTDQSVYEAARERMQHIFERFDRVVVSFSGGKDSTVCLQLALEEARKRNRLPLEVVFFDEEAIHPETIDYVERVRQMPDVKLYWYCLPFNIATPAAALSRGGIAGRKRRGKNGSGKCLPVPLQSFPGSRRV
jgi:predicted phosphoadenosine phosphosulfate sulfurtransferase